MRNYSDLLYYKEDVKILRKLLYDNGILFSEIEVEWLYEKYSDDVLCSWRFVDEDSKKQFIKWLKNEDMWED